jgi:hypothetical protein
MWLVGVEGPGDSSDRPRHFHVAAEGIGEAHLIRRATLGFEEQRV